MGGRVYVSSTARDLRGERDAVILALREKGYEPVHFELDGSRSEPVQESCCSDVRSCDAYVLLVGWRYGFRPSTDREGRSITEIEYAEAERHNLHRLAYRTPDITKPGRLRRWLGLQDGADLRDVLAFRERLSLEMSPREFGSLDELTKHLGNDLIKWEQRRRPQPRLAVSRHTLLKCDRVEHSTQVREGLNASGPAVRPAVFLVHGGRYQGHHYFAERIATLEMPKRVRKTATLFARVDWTDSRRSADFVQRMHADLGDKLAGRADVGGESAAGLSLDDIARLRFPIVVSVEVHAERWSTALARDVQSYAASWCSGPLDRLRAPAAVLISVRREGVVVRKDLEAIARDSGGRVVLVDELEDVVEEQVRRWVEDERLHESFGIADAFTPLRSLFLGRAGWPMEDLWMEIVKTYAALKAS